MKRKLLSVLLTLCLAFSLLPTAALADGEGTQTNDVAQIGETKYATLQEAVNAANDNTVKLLENVTEDINIPTGINVTLDLNGHKITNVSGHTITVEKGGKLNISDSVGTGVVDNTSHGKGAIVNSGEVTLNGGTFKRSAEKGTYSPYGNGGNSWYTIANYGTMEINTGVTVENAGGYSSMIRNGGEATADCNLTIRGGNFVGGVNTVKNDYFGVLTINGGNFSNTAQYVIMNWNKAEITAGTFRTLDTASAVLFTSAFGGNANYVGKLTISGGEFKHASDTQEMIVDHYDESNKGNAVVTGGKFDADISKYIPTDYVQSADGTVEKLGETNAVAKVGGTYYKTLADAVAAAQDGDTITLLKDCSSERVNLESKSITIDLNGNTLTSTSAYGVMFCAKNGHKITVNGTKEGSKLVGTLMVTNGTDGHIEINGGTYESSQYCPIYINGSVSTDNSTLTVKNATITASNSGSNQDTGCGVYLAGYSTSAFENTTVTAPSTGIEIRAGRLTLTNCNVTGGSGKVTADANGNGTTVKNAALAISQHTTKKPIDVTINGGTFTGTAPIYQTDVQGTGSSNVKAEVKNGQFNGAVSAATDGTIAVSGGTFSSEVPGSCCAPGFVPTQNGNTYGVEIKANMAAEVLDAQGKTVGAYDTLAAAITAAKNGETVKLLKDVELTSTLNLAKNITIDGQGKYTIKAANNFIVGKDNNTCCVLYVSGEVTLKDVTVNGNEKCRVIFCDKGKLTIDGATITNGKAPNFIGGVYMTSSASFEMKSGSITGNKNAELYQNEKYLQYSSDLWIGANANGALTAINGGTIGNVFVNANAWSASNPGSFTMNGGTVTNLYVEHDANYGATFKYNDGTIEHLYLSKENGNGQSIEVTPVKGVIYNGGVKEEDLVTLTLKYNDGATADTTYNVASGTTITLPTPAYRSGYTFNGWYDGSTKVSSPYKVTKNVILTASWSYNYSGGSSSYDPTYSVSTPSKTENGSVTVSPKNASKGDTVTVTVKPDSGYVLETLTVTDKNGNELTLKDKGDGKYTFTMPAGKVEVKATFMEDNSMLNFFYDVPNNAYFYEAVKWAVENGITTGVGNDLFAPEQPCTRAQIVTFLWRAAGSPEPKGAASGMSDVVSGGYYEKAVAWAIENGITTGTTTSTFSPDATCTRAQAVTFLARALKAKAASAAEFSDVPTDSYFADAVAWAAANGVTEGIGGGLFGSDNDCTRGQIVTFLYRAYNK